jgi:hypothetical protein
MLLLPLKRSTLVVPDVVTLATLLAADKFPAASFAFVKYRLLQQLIL